MQRPSRRGGIALLFVVLGASALGALWLPANSTAGSRASSLTRNVPRFPRYVPHAIPPFLTPPSDVRLWR